jgi:hypothetical protein
MIRNTLLLGIKDSKKLLKYSKRWVVNEEYDSDQTIYNEDSWLSKSFLFSDKESALGESNLFYNSSINALVRNLGVPDSIKKDIYTSMYYKPRFNRTRNEALERVTDRMDQSRLEFAASDRDVNTKTNLSIDNLISGRLPKQVSSYP